MYQEDSFKTSQVVYAHTRSDEADMEYKMHCHNSYEIYYMVKGNVEYFLEGTSYIPKPGSLLIIPPSCFHGLRVLDGSEYSQDPSAFCAGAFDRERKAAAFRDSWKKLGVYGGSVSSRMVF